MTHRCERKDQCVFDELCPFFDRCSTDHPEQYEREKEKRR